MLVGMALGFVLPEQVYLFLISSGGFSLLFAYVVIMATHYKFRQLHGCPPAGNCQMPGYPYTSWLVLASIIAIMASMPLIPGQASGLIAGLSLVALYTIAYMVKRYYQQYRNQSRAAELDAGKPIRVDVLSLNFETAEELSPKKQDSTTEPDQVLKISKDRD